MIRTSFATILFSTRILYIFISRNILLFSYITSLSYFTLHTRSYILFFVYLLFLSLSYQLSSASSHNSSSLSLPFLIIILLVSFSFIEIFSTYFFLLCVTVFLLVFLCFFFKVSFISFPFILYFFYCFFFFLDFIPYLLYF